MTKNTTNQRGKTSTNKEVYSTDVDELNARIKVLEAQLEKSEIRAIAYDRLIDIAEDKFNIPLRKKGTPSVKQLARRKQNANIDIIGFATNKSILQEAHTYTM